MLSYAIRRFLGAIPTLFIIITLGFFMMRIAPGGPFDSNRRLPPEIEHNIKADVFRKAAVGHVVASAHAAGVDQPSLLSGHDGQLLGDQPAEATQPDQSRPAAGQPLRKHGTVRCRGGLPRGSSFHRVSP